MNAPLGKVVDHKNGNGLDNRKENLRVITQAENMKNTWARHSDNKYRGVYLLKKTNRWRAFIQADNKWIHLGYYSNLEDAARAYDKAAKKYFGEYAHLNFPQQ